MRRRGYRTGQLPDRDPTPPEEPEMRKERNPAIDEDQLASLQILPDGRAYMARPAPWLGIVDELDREGRADVRWIWDEYPDMRESFGSEPPESWGDDDA